mmetsp:Transcript_109055/g.308488  ORF Transcript_109055/g.308488 Transcript_109055/m.308488 type:complete len:248 (-) Transcript_109055:199-942(-)
MPSVRLHTVALLETQGADLARLDALREGLPVEVPADEHEAGLAGLPLLPRELLLEAALEYHVHPLEHVLTRIAFDREDALVAEEVARLRLHERPDPHPELEEVELALEAHARGAHRRVVLVFPLRVQELRVHVHHALHVEGPDVEELRRVHLAEQRVDDVDVAVDLLDLLLDLCERVFIHKVALVQQDAVCKCNLLDGLILNTLRLLFSQVLQYVFRINDSDDGIEMVAALHVIIDEKRLRHRCWIG